MSIRLYTLIYVDLLIFSLTGSLIRGQTISTSTPVPPLQWINLTNLLQGSSAPPLRDASIGYDESSRNVLIFGGESAGGFPQSGTYLLNLESLTWITPDHPTNLANAPPARSAAISGDDFAASNRHGHVVIGGKGTNNVPLSDVWEFDYVNQFWSQVGVSPGGPSARWSAAGGIDFLTAPIQDPVVPGPNNTIYLAGGFDGSSLIPLSDVWEFRISGTLSSNLPNSVNGSWYSSPIGNLPAVTGEAGVVLGQQIAVAGGCNTTLNDTAACAQQDAFVINIQANNDIAPSNCVTPRSGPAFAQNYNGFSSSFATQVFYMFGTFNTSLWQDDGNLDKGEVDVLDISTGTWARILPSGDPGTSGTPAFPGPRQGAVSISYTSALVGGSRNSSADTLVFGGEDADGNYLSEVWLLRAYNGVVTSSGQQWSGFGNGQLQTGVDANGAGVTVQYISTCATPTNTPQPSSSGGSSTPTSPFTPSPSAGKQAYEVSLSHKLLAPISVGMIFPALALIRFCASGSASPPLMSNYRSYLLYPSIVLGVASYGVGIGGLVSSFTSDTTTTIAKRSAYSPILKTTHGRAGLALFLVAYGVMPLLFLVVQLRQRFFTADSKEENLVDTETVPRDSGEKDVTSPDDLSPLPQTSPSWWPVNWSRIRQTLQRSTDLAITSGRSQASFEVLNRRPRPRLSSAADSLDAPGSVSSQTQPPRLNVRHLVDGTWQERRHTLNTLAGEDYTAPHANHTPGPSASVTNDVQSTQALMAAGVSEKSQHAILPSPTEIVLRVLFHASVLGLCIVCLVELWSHSSPGFAVFFVWIVIFYFLLSMLAWHSIPPRSLLSVLFARIQDNHRVTGPQATMTGPSSIGLDSYPFPTPSRGPYLHRPPYRAIPTGNEEGYPPRSGTRSVEAVDDDEDEDTRQRRIEDEMNRRDISIVTVPRAKLWITNPS